MYIFTQQASFSWFVYLARPVQEVDTSLLQTQENQTGFILLQNMSILQLRFQYLDFKLFILQFHAESASHHHQVFKFILSSPLLSCLTSIYYTHSNSA